MNKITFFLSISLLIFGCKTKQKVELATINTKDHTEITVDEPRDTTSLLEIFTDQTVTSNDTGDAYQVLSAMIENNILWLEVSYGGGCKEHYFKMFSSNEIQQDEYGNNLVSLILWHNGNNDVCRSIVRQKIRFNLKPLQRSQHKEFEIKLSNQKKLRYSY